MSKAEEKINELINNQNKLITKIGELETMNKEFKDSFDKEIEGLKFEQKIGDVVDKAISKRLTTPAEPVTPPVEPAKPPPEPATPPAK